MKLMMIDDFEGTPRTRPVALRTNSFELGSLTFTGGADWVSATRPP
jgi:hypothetical protein